ncbi:alpha/beta fold hydrolase [Bradyrhizobium genosp. P]|uniref:alpha/beta fold hydrolase n=1 Tax=Bradyrhizobium genosp. P TaxID=83641 RepID=UPI003CF79F20
MADPRVQDAPVNTDDPQGFNHKFADVNGIRLHYVDEGQGPLVILVHGFPYLWYAWRSQIRALAAAGYRAVALDLRGYGQTEKPASVDAYDHTHVAGDLVGLMKTLGETSAAIVGHDVGAGIVNAAALLRPDLFRAVGVLCTAPGTRGPVKPSVTWKAMEKDNLFYQHYFQDSKADREMAGDIRKFLLGAMYSVSGSVAGADRWRLFVEKGETILDTATLPEHFPSWLSQQAQDYYVSEFTRTGFTGALNHYRCRDMSWEVTSFLDGAVLRQPGICIVGGNDPAFPAVKAAYEKLETHMINLRNKVMLPGVGHAPAEEQPSKVSDLLIEFLRGL